MTFEIEQGARAGATSLVEFVYLRLRDGIVQAQYGAGVPLRPGAIAQEFGVSIIPVREAVRRLEADGLVVIEPNRGARVAEMSPEDLTDIYETRKLLEVEALRRSQPRLSDAEIAEIAEALQSMVSAYGKGDTADGMIWHRRFHYMMYAHAQSPHLQEFINSLWTASDRYMWASPLLLHKPDFHDEHQEILAALQRRDVDAAIAALEEHHDLALERIHATIPGPTSSRDAE